MIPKFPFFTAQQLNLDWVMQTLKKILAFMPIDKGAIGDVLQRKANGAAWEPIAAVTLDIHGLNTAEAVADDDEIPIYDKTATGNRKATLSSILSRVTYPVTSVNGQTGAVTVSVPVQSVNGQTGAVVLDAADVGAATPNESSSGSASGYCKTPDGTLFQWGHYTVNTESTMTQISTSGVYFGTDELTFPTPFVDNNYTVSGTSRYATGYAIPIGGVTRTGSVAFINIFDFYPRLMNDGKIVVYWQAIGRWK